MVNPLKYIKTFFHREVERVDTYNSRKRKREADDCDQGEHNGRWQDDDDVIITAVKRPRTDNQQAFKFFNNFIGNPLEKMSEWFKNKKVWRPSYMQNSSYQESRELAGERFKPPDRAGRNGRLRDGSGQLHDGTSYPEERQVSQNTTIPIIQSKQQARQSINKQASTSHRPFYKKKTPPPQEASVIQHAPPTSTQNQTSVSSQQQTVQEQQSGPRHSHIQTMSVPIQTGMSYASVLKAGPSTVSRGVQGICGNGKQSLFEMKPYKKFAATECIKMEEREKYKQLLQQFTTVPLSLSPPRSHDSDRVSISSRGSSRAQDSIQGDTICRNYSSQRKSITPEDSVPRQKVVPVHIVKSDASFLSRRFNPDFLNSTRVNHILNDSSRQVSKKKLWSSPEIDEDSVKCVNKDRVGNRDRSELRTENRERLENTEDVICIGDDEAAEISAIPKVNGDISYFERSRLEGRKSPFSDALQESVYLKEDWMTNIVDRFSAEKRERRRKILEEEARVKYHEEQRKTKDENLVKKIQSQMRIYEKEPAVIEDIPIPEIEIEEEEEFPELTDDMQRVIKDALRPHPADQVLVEGYKLQITRTDVSTLAGLNWLNDEIINFYMNMLMERGEAEGKPKVHAFNTFFYPKILNGGHSSVRRWTKRVDVFAMDYILIPVHLGMHWCLAVVDFRKKVIRYYDSMGGQNNQCLNAIKKYLCEESLDKKKQEFDLNGWRTEIAKDIPQQMNGSDCGMFACKFAEYITREAKITFSQENMPYFRRRMVYEIVKKKLLQ